MSVGEWPISFYEQPDDLSVAAVRPLMTLPRPRRKKFLFKRSVAVLERVKWLEWVQRQITTTTAETDMWNDDRWEDWGILPEELSFEAWRRRYRSAKL